MRRGWEFWIDRGGTFTDVVARAPDGALQILKLLSENPEHYSDAAVEGVRMAMGLAEGTPIPAATIDAVKMGTTVATNALLERKGEPTLLAITAGFADALRIGYQNRPRLFDREIVLPSMLYADVVEIDERVRADGTTERVPDRARVSEQLGRARAAGIDAIAIALIHGWRWPEHERIVAEVARELGFAQISVSHRVSPLAKLVGRGDTTVVDAYLSPVLRRYVDRVAAALGEVPLRFMQSSGGLIDAAAFRGKDAILSGPAGGIVGAVATSAEAGFDAIIGFDMGGTSTDVAHFHGRFERTFETEVAGVRVRAPMLEVHTVAAGGGSVCRFEAGRYQVGPESAGAIPGPACYRRGGPLTVTDCNVMLGKLQPRVFPRVFGPRGDRGVDVEVVRERFAALAETIAEQTGDRRSPEAVAEGFLAIAVANMADAIARISIERGHDLERYALCCFGGAGGQHACLVADALGLHTVCVHPFAGVLSAYGMGLARARALRERSLGVALGERAVAEAEGVFAALEDDARRELAAIDRGGEAEIAVEAAALLRYAGSDRPLTVPWTTPAGMRAAFEREHEDRYGFVLGAGAEVVVDALLVEASIAPTQSRAPTAPRTAGRGSADPVPEFVVDARMAGQTRSTPVYARASLPVGAVVAGPAIIHEPTGTTVVEPRWRARVGPTGHLVLTRAAGEHEVAGPRPELRPWERARPDPVRLEVFNNLFGSIAEQMGGTLRNTAHSVNIKERLDFSCAVFDGDGRLIANAPHMPVHLGSMGASVRAVLSARGPGSGDERGMRRGDAYIVNAPYNGGTHLPDVTVISPVFLAGESSESPTFFVASRGHHADIGGITPGSMPADSRHVDEEGVRFDDFVLVDAGALRREAVRAHLTAGPWPARDPEQNLADLEAQLAANHKGIRELERAVAHWSPELVGVYMGHVRANAAEAVRAAIVRLAETTGRALSFRQAMDDGSAIAVAIDIDPRARSCRVDFAGTSAQRSNNFNAPLAVCQAAVLYVFRTLVDADIPMNEGCLDPIELRVPEGCMLNPRYPAAVVAGNVETSQAIVDALYGALEVVAASQGTMNNLTFGNDRHQYYETVCGGSGAGPDFDGTDAVHTHMTNSRLTDPEILEQRHPVVVEAFEIRRGSGGRGRHRGGDGVRRRLRFLEAMDVVMLANRRVVPPYGVAGGEPGAVGRNWVERDDGSREELGPTASVRVRPGEVFVLETPGGGGWGEPD